MSALRSIIPEYDIELMRGDGETFEFTITEGGVAVDLTNYELRYTVKKRKTDVDADKILQKTEGSGIDVTDAENGVGIIRFNQSDFTAYVGTRNRQEVFVHDMQIQLDSEAPHTVFRGRLTLLADVDNG